MSRTSTAGGPAINSEARVRPFLVSCDESGTGGARYYGFGSLWMPWDRRGDFVADLRQLGQRHGVVVEEGEDAEHEFKWSKVKDHRLAFYRAVAEYFFLRPWLLFHCIVVRKADVNRKAHRGGLEEARRKHLTLLLTNKIDRALRKQPKRKFRIWVDPIPSPCAKADEAIAVIANRVLCRTRAGENPVEYVRTHQSHQTPSIQLCDLLLGAVMAGWQEETQAPAKLEIQRWIAEHLGWGDLRGDTFPHEKKFNVWFFCSPRNRPPDVETRRVSLRYPLPGGLESSLPRTADVRIGQR